jgi:hypothetical protein
MAGGNGISGIDGDVVLNSVPVHEIKKWSFKPKTDNKDYASNYTFGFKKRVSSVADATGSFDFVWDPFNPLTDFLDVGDEATLDLFVTTGQFYVVPVIIDDYSLDVDIETGAVVGGTMSWSLNGGWTNPIAKVATPLMGPTKNPVRNRARRVPDGQEGTLATEAKKEIDTKATSGAEIGAEDILKIADAVYHRMMENKAQKEQAA